MSNMLRSNYGLSRRRVLLIPLLLVATLAGVWLYAHGTSPPPYGSSAPGFGWWFPFGWFFFIPVFFLAFFCLRWFFWGSWGGGWGYGGYYYSDSALETLRQRFARGEITKEQYDQMRKDLQQAQ